MNKIVGTNARGEPISVNKNGYQCVYFKDRKPDFFEYALDKINRVRAMVHGALGLELFMMYGSLLGPCREGGFIGHDDDFDLCYVSKHTDEAAICDEVLSLVSHLRGKGYRVSIASYGFLQVHVDDIFFDVFVGWIKDGKFYLYWGIPEGIPVSDVLPLGWMQMYGRNMRVPAKPEASLEAIYGPGWRVPDPNFRYTVDVRYHQNFGFLIKGWPKETGNSYWNKAYKEKPIPQYPSQFAISVLPELAVGARVLDIGCGNGRDALFLASHGHSVVGADASSEAIAKANAAGVPTAQFEQLDLYSQQQVGAFIERHSGEFDVVYARFFIHAVDASGETVFWRIAKNCLKPGGRIYAELRTIKDIDNHKGRMLSPTECITDHYRRFVEPAELKQRAAGAGFEVVYEVEGHGMAKYKAEDPHVMRVIFQRAVLKAAAA